MRPLGSTSSPRFVKSFAAIGCSNSAHAQALSSLRRGTAEGALAAGTNLILGTGPYISFSKAEWQTVLAPNEKHES